MIETVVFVLLVMLISLWVKEIFLTKDKRNDSQL